MESPKTYPFFESGQVLAHTHLNDLRRFLDEHNRLTRIRLDGTGIVCGLTYTLNSPGTDSTTIVIDTGFGISTSGYLIELFELPVTYTHYRTYVDPSTVDYNFGNSPDTDIQPDDDDVTYRDDDDDEDVAVALELLTDGTGDGDPKTLGSLADLEDKVLVLYLELLDTDLKSCTGSNCDNKGMERTVSVKALLLDPSVFESEDDEPALLPQLNIPKTIFDSLDSSKTPLDIIDLEHSADLDQLFNTISTAQATTLSTALTNAKTQIGTVLDITGTRVENLKTAISNLLTSGETYRQYVYDALKDLTFAWNEFADRFNDLLAQGDFCFSSDAFPRHLSLGIVGEPVTGLNDAHRDVFRASPAVTGTTKEMTIVQMLFAKMEQLATRFSAAEVNYDEIDITPDQPSLSPHSGRSIPYYYQVSSATDALLKTWNPEKTMRRRQAERYSYYAEAFTSSPYFRHPMKYAQDGHPLLRIEGIKNQNIDDVLERIEELKRKYDLAFPVKVLYFQDGTGMTVTLPGDSDNFFYEDLQEQYYELRDKPLRIIDGLMLYINSVVPYVTDVSNDPDPETSDGAKDILVIIENVLKMLAWIKEKYLAMFPVCLPEFARNFDKFKFEYRNLIRVLMKTLLDTGWLDGIVSGVKTSDKYALHLTTLISEAISLITVVLGGMTERYWFKKYYDLYVRYESRKKRSRAKAEKFEDFAPLHCGMEHLAGTYTYGTFLLVCKPVIYA